MACTCGHELKDHSSATYERQGYGSYHYDVYGDNNPCMFKQCSCENYKAA